MLSGNDHISYKLRLGHLHETVRAQCFKDCVSDSVHISNKLKFEVTLWTLHEGFVFVILHSVNTNFGISVHFSGTG